jgi:hypothetical protein
MQEDEHRVLVHCVGSVSKDRCPFFFSNCPKFFERADESRGKPRSVYRNPAQWDFLFM